MSLSIFIMSAYSGLYGVTKTEVVILDAYFITQTIDITIGGCAGGQLVLMQDKKLQGRKQYKDRLNKDKMVVFQNLPESKWPDYKNASLFLKNSKGEIVGSAELEQAWASIDVKNLYGNTLNTYFIRTDHQTGYGIFSGWAMSLYEVDGCRLKEVTATDAKTGKTEAFDLDDTLRRSWEIVPLGTDGKSEIIQLICTPYAPGGTELTFERYCHTKSGWVKYSRTEKGYWENGSDSFPDVKKFPDK